MKHFLLFSILIICFGHLTYSQIDSNFVGPGVTYYSEVRSSGPLQFDIVKIDLTNPWLKLKTVKAQDKLFAFEKTSSMASRNNYEGNRVVAAINADFYNTGNGEPISTQVSDGQLLKNAADRWNFAWNTENKSMLAVVSSSGSVIKGDSSRLINGFNASRQADYLILYNSYFGSKTNTNIYGTEVLVNPLNGWKINDTIFCVVESKSTAGSMTIPTGKGVLSGNGVSSAFIENNLNVGDTVKLLVNITPSLPNLNQLIGGGPVIVRNGIVEGDNVRHPRTAIGITQDSTTLYFVTVDGRQPGYSVGMTLTELGNYMKELGCYQALNLDGGGSTTMVVRGEIKNSPSDPGGERTVSNSLLLISTALTGPLHHIVVSPHNAFTVAGTNTQFTAAGYDEYYNSVNLSSVQWSCSQELGTINISGILTAASDTATGYVYAQVGSLIDSSVVHITKVSSISLLPDPVILNPGQQQQITATAKDNYNNIIPLTSSQFSWNVTGSIGTITSSGYFTATTTGEGTITAEYDSVVGTAAVQIGVSTYSLIDDFTAVLGYSLSDAFTNLNECSFERSTDVFVSSPSSAKLHYSFITGGTSAIYINKNIPISGTPDKIGISVYGDGRAHWLRGEFKDKDGERFLINFTDGTPGISWTNEWQYIEKDLSTAIASWANPNAVLTFPVSWMRLYLTETSDAKKDSGTIYFDDFQVHHVAVSVEDEYVPLEFALQQNYPNPFNPATKINYSVPAGNNFVTLKVFDILGNEAAILVNEVKAAGNYEAEFNASKYPSGIYFYRINAGSFTLTKKMILLK